MVTVVQNIQIKQWYLAWTRSSTAILCWRVCVILIIKRSAIVWRNPAGRVLYTFIIIYSRPYKTRHRQFSENCYWGRTVKVKRILSLCHIIYHSQGKTARCAPKQQFSVWFSRRIYWNDLIAIVLLINNFVKYEFVITYNNIIRYLHRSRCVLITSRNLIFHRQENPDGECDISDIDKNIDNNTIMFMFIAHL